MEGGEEMVICIFNLLTYNGDGALEEGRLGHWVARGPSIEVPRAGGLMGPDVGAEVQKGPQSVNARSGKLG